MKDTIQVILSGLINVSGTETTLNPPPTIAKELDTWHCCVKSVTYDSGYDIIDVIVGTPIGNLHCIHRRIEP